MRPTRYECSSGTDVCSSEPGTSAGPGTTSPPSHSPSRIGIVRLVRLAPPSNGYSRLATRIGCGPASLERAHSRRGCRIDDAEHIGRSLCDGRYMSSWSTIGFEQNHKGLGNALIEGAPTLGYGEVSITNVMGGPSYMADRRFPRRSAGWRWPHNPGRRAVAGLHSRSRNSSGQSAGRTRGERPRPGYYVHPS